MATTKSDYLANGLKEYASLYRLLPPEQQLIVREYVKAKARRRRLGRWLSATFQTLRCAFTDSG